MKKHEAIPVHGLRESHVRGMSLYFRDVDELVEDDILSAHRDDHYIFLFQEEGESRFMVDFNEMILKGTMVHCILPGQVHYFKSSKRIKGWLLAIETLQVPENCRRIFEEDILRLYPVKLGKREAAHIVRSMQTLYELVQDKEHITQPLVFEHASATYISLVANAYLAAENKQSAGGRSAAITRQFRTLLRQHLITDKNPAEYATRLNLSLAYLTECVKETTGMPVSYWIQHELVLEAKRLLYYSDLTVKEVAFALGYDDHTYFSRLFSKVTGMSPGSFRKTTHE
ncbi:MAG: AraC family transcriptional regulator [Filimonas sp.]|nr:AraC family transcriptional regulator [Filimonas sp.]